MGLFGGRRGTPCPICGSEIAKQEKLMHWESHVRLIAAGEGAGGYTWSCVCGPSDMYWEKTHQAAAGLAVHMNQRHGINIV